MIRFLYYRIGRGLLIAELEALQNRIVYHPPCRSFLYSSKLSQGLPSLSWREGIGFSKVFFDLDIVDMLFRSSTSSVILTVANCTGHHEAMWGGLAKALTSERYLKSTSRM
jgi:hypothetical protein